VTELTAKRLANLHQWRKDSLKKKEIDELHCKEVPLAEGKRQLQEEHTKTPPYVGAPGWGDSLNPRHPSGIRGPSRDGRGSSREGGGGFVGKEGWPTSFASGSCRKRKKGGGGKEAIET